MPNQHEDARRRYRSSRFDDEQRDAMSGGTSRRGRSGREVSRDEWSDRDPERHHDRPPSGSSGGYEGVRDADYGGYGSGYGRGGRRYGGDFGFERGGTARGKGPKGYTRADERIREDVCDCLTDDPELDASDIEVQVKGGEVTLSGSVHSRSAKRHAEDLVEPVSGVKNVQNSLRVKESETNPAGRSAAT